MSEAGLREQKKQRVEAELARAAMSLFAAQGFDTVTVDAIARAAGVSRRTFFRYFPSKEDVFFARRREQTARLSALLSSPRPGEIPFETVRRALLALSAEHQASKRRIRVEHAILAGSPALVAKDLDWDRRVEGAFARTLESGAGRSAATRRRARVCAGALVGALRVVIEDWVQGGCRGDLRAAGSEALGWIEPLAPPVR
jgi:AcrR family transcriptional regulator